MISKKDIATINKFRDMYVDTLETELLKLSETSVNTYENDKKITNMFNLLHELNLDYLLEDTKVKRKIK